MLKFKFLTENQVIGKNKLSIFEKYDKKCAVTDFSILLGCKGSGTYENIKGESRKQLIGPWFIKTYNFEEIGYINTWETIISSFDIEDRTIGARPTLPYSEISSFCTNVQVADKRKEVEYGEYPQTIASGKISKILEEAYKNKTLTTTGKTYTYIPKFINFAKNLRNNIEPPKYIEYEYNGEKYIRVVGKVEKSRRSGGLLSNGTEVENGKIYWVKVEPIKWLVDEKNDIAITKKIIFSGVQFDSYYTKFETSEIKKFMDMYFAKDIIPSKIKKVDNSKTTNKIKKTNDLYNAIDEIKKQIEILPLTEQQVILTKLDNIINNGLKIYQQKLAFTNQLNLEKNDPRLILKSEINEIKKQLDSKYPYLLKLKENIDELNKLKEFLLDDKSKLPENNQNIIYETLSNIKSNLSIYPSEEIEKTIIDLIDNVIDKYTKELKYNDSPKFKLPEINYKKELIINFTKIEAKTSYQVNKLNNLDNQIKNLNNLKNSLLYNEQTIDYLKDIIKPLKEKLNNLDYEQQQKLYNEILTLIDNTNKLYKREKNLNKYQKINNDIKLILSSPETNLKQKLIKIESDLKMQDKTLQDITLFNELKKLLKK